MDIFISILSSSHARPSVRERPRTIQARAAHSRCILTTLSNHLSPDRPDYRECPCHDRATASDAGRSTLAKHASERRRPARRFGEVAQQIIELLRSIERAAYDDPALVRELAIYAQRDAALIKAALADIRSWMIDARRGRDEESNGA